MLSKDPNLALINELVCCSNSVSSISMAQLSYLSVVFTSSPTCFTVRGPRRHRQTTTVKLRCFSFLRPDRPIPPIPAPHRPPPCVFSQVPRPRQADETPLSAPTFLRYRPKTSYHHLATVSI